MTNPIFVAGTGRSGTTWLSELLGDHPRVWTMPGESRFLIDPGGLQDLVDVLTERHTPYHAQQALDGFERLLTVRLAGGEDNVFSWWDLPAVFGQQRYADWVARFVGDLTWYTFEERSGRPWTNEPMATPMRIARYFPNRRELTELCGRYLDELFGAAAADAGKSLWCEKTPMNLLSMDFLWELFPSARIVHITRHPVQVVASHLDMPWAPHDVVGVCRWLEPIYQRWFAFAASHPLDERYLQVALEDLAADWPRTRRALFEALELSDVDTTVGPSTERVSHGNALAPEDEAYVRERLGFAISALGYT